MALAEFEDLLKRTMGLDAASVGSQVVERAVRDRLAACGAADPRAYLDRVQSSEQEMQDLIEAVVVPETWFFRHRESFAALIGVALHEWLARSPKTAFRVLSLPCSSGEEPYSIAMALLDAGLSPERFRIDAFDISHRALDDARRGVYGRNSFRGGGYDFRDRHFEAAGDDWRIRDDVRAQVEFRHANLFTAVIADVYDVIFCRNILIYFDRPTQQRAVGLLRQVLADKGLLFVGPSEAALLAAHHFVSAKAPMSFAFRKGEAVERPAPPPAPPPRAPSRVPPRAAVAAPPAAAVRPARAKVSLSLDHALRLADEGRLKEAADCCEQYLAGAGPSAQAFNLMGVLRDAAGDAAGAAGYYRKALYLDPQHPEALAHLALLLESQGDHPGAQVLLDRARRPPMNKGHK